MYRSINKLAQPLQVALLGAPGTDKEQFFALLSEAMKATGADAEIAMPVALDAPFKADTIFLIGLQSTDAQDMDADIALRQLLALRDLPYQVLYGSQKECLAHAVDLIRKLLPDTRDQGFLTAVPSENRTDTIRPWVWVCDKCSDPQCEHRLLTGLLANRSAAATGQLP